jgi:uncharacterized protein involved in response to NO
VLHLGAAPHRALFLTGTAQALLGLLWWLFSLESRLAGGLVATLIPEAAAHGWLMLYGLFPFFIFGFLFTALPNWVEHGKINRRSYLGSAGLMALGAALLYPGLYLPWLTGIGLGLHLAGWGLGLYALYHILIGSRQTDRRQPWLAWSAVAAGLAGDAIFLTGVILDQPGLLDAALGLGVWGFLTPLFLAVCHRMIPFFTSRIVANYVTVRPYAPLWAMVAASLAHGLLEALGLTQWTWLADLPLAALALWFISRWGIARTLHEPLLAMLHIGFVWSALAFLLYGLDSLMALFDAGRQLGLAPLHALGIGFCTSLLLAMATRVTLGHSGRPLKADRLTWMLFWLVQLTALTRMAPELLPEIIPWRAMSLATLFWLICFGAWAWKYAPIYWRPRADGKPG